MAGEVFYIFAVRITVGQLDRSVKTALEKHPNLRQYTICMAFDHPDPDVKVLLHLAINGTNT